MRTHSRNQIGSGSTLVAVFWLLSILGLALFSAMALLRYESDLVTSQTHGTRARHMAERGIAVGANRIIERDDPLLQQSFEDGSGFRVQFTSEADKFDINSILTYAQQDNLEDKGWLRELFYDWGMELEDAQDLVDALIDWVDEGELEEMNGAEKPYYETLGYIDRPFNRPFYSLEEMRFVRGMDLLEQVNPNWQSWFTVWTQKGLSVNDASAEKLSIALGVSYDDADQVVEQVRGPDRIRGTEDDEPFGSYAQAFGPDGLIYIPPDEFQLLQHRINGDEETVRIESTGYSGDTKRRITLIIRNRSGNPSLLQRREEVVQ